MGFDLSTLTDEQLNALEIRFSKMQPEIVQQPTISETPTTSTQQFDVSSLSDAQLNQLETSLSKQPVLEKQEPIDEIGPSILSGLKAVGRGFAGGFHELARGFGGLPEKPEELKILEELQGVQPREEMSFDEAVKTVLPPSGKGYEKEVEEISRDATILLSPLGPVKGLSLMRSIGTSLFSNMASKGLVDAKVIDEGNRDLAKFGLTFFSNFVRPLSISKTAKGLLNNAEELVKDTIITDYQAAPMLKEIARDLKRAGGSEVNPRAIGFLDGIIKDVDSGTFQGDLVTKAVRNLNKLRQKVGFASADGIALNKVRGGLQNIAENIGVNKPGFINSWNEGNQLYQAANSQNAVSAFIKKKIPLSTAKEAPKSMLLLLGIQPKALGIGASLYGANAVANSINRVAKFPAVQRLYLKFINQAMSDNVSASIKTFNQLKKAFEKIEKKENED